MANAGIGVDIVSISRMRSILDRTPAFARRVYTEEERRYCDASARPAAHYACRFAAREAVLKALGIGFSGGVGLHDVAVSKDQQGRPIAVLSGRALEVARELGVVEVALSLSFTTDLAIANAMAITEASRPKPKRDPKEDEKAFLARSFKEARSVLDELERVQDEELSSISGETDILHQGESL
ncbi:MAG: holo-ACP synthase [Collinsella sp.]|nr:holo-ACP synthase [Collinsella sp.]